VTARAIVVGAGPAGLMAAEQLAAHGAAVDVYDGMPSVARKFLLAGKGGLNLTHAEPLASFIARYGGRGALLRPMLEAFGPQALREWTHGLGLQTFVGTSGRVFPAEMKAAPLLRAWLHRLRASGIRIHVRHRWLGWGEAGVLRFAAPGGERHDHADAVVLALGGGSWARLGSDGTWVPLLAARGVDIAALRASNCGFDVAWSAPFRARFAGTPVKTIAGRTTDTAGATVRQHGEIVITEHGVEGGLVYALSSHLRAELERAGRATLWLDLAPGREQPALAEALMRAPARESLANRLRKRAGLAPVKAALLREVLAPDVMADSVRLAASIKDLPIALRAARPIDEAISSAGGVRFEALDEHLMLRGLPGVFVAGEMLDWDAPTGGYLLTACFATGWAAGLGASRWLSRKHARAQK
jgi:uncharacterized flavoprotein (TIGR03862 family)